MDYAVVEGFKHSSLPKIVMGDIDVDNALRRVSVEELCLELVEEIARMVRGMQDYEIEDRK
jgi:molybdopterin-guanine dinucleotide biosynthesis protein